MKKDIYLLVLLLFTILTISGFTNRDEDQNDVEIVIGHFKFIPH